MSTLNFYYYTIMGRYITNSGGIHTTGYQQQKKKMKKKKGGIHISI